MTEPRLAARRGDTGMITVWTVVIVLACVAMVGLVLDGGVILRAHSSTFDLAAESARAGAQQLDQRQLADGHLALDPNQVQAAVTEFLAARGAVGAVSVNGTRVTVTVTRSVHLQILKPAVVSVRETATVQAHRGAP